MNNQLFSHKKQTEYCPQCGGELHIRQGKKGRFLGCSNYPSCNYLKSLQPHHEVKIFKDLEQNCPKCNNHLQLKQGSFGMFIGCSNYPECHFIVTEEKKDTEEFPCPACHKGNLISRRGRNGKYFYGCNHYPKCKFTIVHKPEEQHCPYCHGTLAILKKENETQQIWLCINPKCQQNFCINKDIEEA